MLVSRVWATTGLSFKVKKLIDEKTRIILENKSEDFNSELLMEDISKLLSLDWKLSRQLWRMREELKTAQEKEGVQQ